MADSASLSTFMGSWRKSSSENDPVFPVENQRLAGRPHRGRSELTADRRGMVRYNTKVALDMRLDGTPIVDERSRSLPLGVHPGCFRAGSHTSRTSGRRGTFTAPLTSP